MHMRASPSGVPSALLSYGLGMVKHDRPGSHCCPLRQHKSVSPPHGAQRSAAYHDHALSRQTMPAACIDGDLIKKICDPSDGCWGVLLGRSGARARECAHMCERGGSSKHARGFQPHLEYNARCYACTCHHMGAAMRLRSLQQALVAAARMQGLQWWPWPHGGKVEIVQAVPDGPLLPAPAPCKHLSSAPGHQGSRPSVTELRGRHSCATQMCTAVTAAVLVRFL
jgi:hypothetical protein